MGHWKGTGRSQEDDKKSSCCGWLEDNNNTRESESTISTYVHQGFCHRHNRIPCELTCSLVLNLAVAVEAVDPESFGQS